MPEHSGRPAAASVPPAAPAVSSASGAPPASPVSFPYGLAERLSALPPSCGPVRLIAVDGPAGSGKTTLAARLSEALGGAVGNAPVLHLDDLATHDAFFGWTARLERQVLRPLSRGEPAHYEVYDWTRREFTGVRTLPPAPVVLVEGVGAGRRALRPHLARVLWMEVPPGLARARGEARDGPGLAGFWARWLPAERAHFAADPTRPHAHLLVRQCPQRPGRPAAYEVLPGPAGCR